MDWWAHLQPEWRGVYPLASQPPEDSDWSELRKGGPNGFFILLLSFVWWGKAIESMEEHKIWLEFSGDLDWVIGQLLHDIGNAEGESEEEPVAKMFFFSISLAVKFSNMDDRARTQ